MGSINAQRVGLKVSETIKRGELVKLGKIIEETGYSKKTALNPRLITNTKSYKRAIELESKPLIDGIQREIARIKESMSKRDLDKEEYRTLIGALDILNKNYQLLSGGATSRQVLVLPSEIIDKNNITVDNESQ